MKTLIFNSKTTWLFGVFRVVFHVVLECRLLMKRLILLDNMHDGMSSFVSSSLTVSQQDDIAPPPYRGGHVVRAHDCEDDSECVARRLDICTKNIIRLDGRQRVLGKTSRQRGRRAAGDSFPSKVLNSNPQLEIFFYGNSLADAG